MFRYVKMPCVGGPRLDLAVFGIDVVEGFELHPTRTPADRKLPCQPYVYSNSFERYACVTASRTPKRSNATVI